MSGLVPGKHNSWERDTAPHAHENEEATEVLAESWGKTEEKPGCTGDATSAAWPCQIASGTIMILRCAGPTQF